MSQAFSFSPDFPIVFSSTPTDRQAAGPRWICGHCSIQRGLNSIGQWEMNLLRPCVTLQGIELLLRSIIFYLFYDGRHFMSQSKLILY